jgi:hypothetical protein
MREFEMAKTLTTEERMRRLLIGVYDGILQQCGEDLTGKIFLDKLAFLDAVKDCITGNEGGMCEWSITPTGNLKFK